MKQELITLARHRITRARECLIEAGHLMDSGGYRGAINRFYYGAFYAARALLALKELDSARHSGIISLFQASFVKAGVFDVDKARALPRAFEKRQKTDYSDYATVTKEEAEAVGREVAAFIDESENVLERILDTP
ncbi:MAG: HEPN domain-containing protein [Candidatus Eremiobacteraeota bacterium]|nr:HEPN domain-containing protein [Candidatus Eremiobacteraeota bacterium]